jgi:biopolymer transport protein ExbD
MQMSARAKRMDRHHRRHKGGGQINLVSMMDIFTILVFFLLVSSVNVEVLPNPKDLKLPESIAEQRARENVVVTVTRDEILVQGRPVARVAEVMAREDLRIPALEEALRSQTDRVLRKESVASVADREITIMGDRDTPYRVLKRIMAACTQADYGRLSLAVTQKAPRAAPAVAANTGS